MPSCRLLYSTWWICLIVNVGLAAAARTDGSLPSVVDNARTFRQEQLEQGTEPRN